MKCSLKKYGIWVSNMYVCVYIYTHTGTEKLHEQRRLEKSMW